MQCSSLSALIGRSQLGTAQTTAAVTGDDVTSDDVTPRRVNPPSHAQQTLLTDTQTVNVALSIRCRGLLTISR